MIDIAGSLASFFRHIRPARRQPPIASREVYVDFLAGRAAFVSQKKLFEYVKQRMGTSFPRHFEDDTFIASLNIAKWRVYSACISDLSLWMAGQLVANGAGPEEAQAIAVASHHSVVADRFADPEFDGDQDEIRREFEARAALVDWRKIGGDDYAAFERSARELVRWAPIADQLKRYDTEIVANSIRFAWLHIRDEFRRNLRAADALDDWRRHLAATV